ncbi:ubiquitin binding protein [Aureococcus anophagefferens]|nr:ubiquitin binding protein [Aureococcus anophagefferens]
MVSDLRDSGTIFQVNDDIDEDDDDDVLEQSEYRGPPGIQPAVHRWSCGGKSFIAIGDLNQLPAVERDCYEEKVFDGFVFPRLSFLELIEQRKQQLGDYGADDDDAPRPPHVAGAFDDFAASTTATAALRRAAVPGDHVQPADAPHAPRRLQAARAQGKAELKWLLVVITNEQVFGCHQMNRDAWADETVQAVVEASFVLWLRPHTDPAAVTYADRYDKDRAIPQIWAHPKHPHLAVVDPRTGRRLWMREA